jgi:hypothetical protein
MEKSNDILMPEFERLLKEGHMVEFAPKGVSMRPFIEGGRDKVVLKACNEPQVGMIVLARINQAFVLHRIYKIRGKKIILQGDGNLTGQEVCKAEDIIGRVVRVKGKYGKRKRLTRGRLWRHMPLLLKKLVLKVYRICILLTDYED